MTNHMPKDSKRDPKKSVLIVEDSPDFSNLLKFIAEDEGFEGIQFPVTDDDIVSWAKKHKPSVILMDLALRKKTGMEYIEDLKANPATKNIPIVIITGRDLAQKEVVALEIRNVKYLRKGRVEMAQIRNAIKNAGHVKTNSGEIAKKDSPTEDTDP